MTKSRAPNIAGLLSQSLHPSTTIRQILPAQIRDITHRDVVFVGENFIQLREFLPSGRLTDLTGRFDLGGKILKAKVISSKFEPISFVDQVFNQDVNQYRIVGSESGFPPQLLVVSMAPYEIVFLYARDRALGVVEFVSARKTLTATGPMPELYGRHLAVDHESRAMAVASAHGFCAILSLKSAHEIAEEIASCNPKQPRSFRPSLEEHVIRVDGLIMAIDFLPPPSDSQHDVMLLLLVHQRGGTYIHLYSWDTRLKLARVKRSSSSGHKLPIEDAHPVMLIPSTKWPSFTIVTETEIVVYDDILSSYTQRINLPLADQFPPKYENSTRHPLWTQWTKPSRHVQYNETHDDICLVREDGVLRHYIIDHSTTTKIEAHYRPGNLGINVDQAFASLDAPTALGSGDVFIVGGDGCDGGVFHCPARSDPIRIQVIPNLAPVQDMLIINSNDHNGSRALVDPDRSERVFLCTGRGTNFTSVSEILYGLEAQIGLAADFDDSSTVSRVWTFPDYANERMIILTSHAENTTAMSFYYAVPDLEVADLESCPGIDTTVPTLTAASLPNGFVIQITYNNVNITAFLAEDPAYSKSCKISAIVAGAVSEQLGMFVTGSVALTGYELQLYQVTCNASAIEVKEVGNIFEMVHAPTAMSFVEVNARHFLIFTTANGLLQIYSIEQMNGAKYVTQIEMATMLKSGEAPVVNSLVVLNQAGFGGCMVLCGLRSGTLACLALSMVGGVLTPDPLPGREYSLGRTTVSVVQDSADTSAALVFCGKEMRRITLLEGFRSLEPLSSQIWLTSQADASYLHPHINGLSRMECSPFLQEHALSGSLVCVSNSQILISSFVLQSQVIPRRLRTQGNPQRLTYSRNLNKLVVALDEVSFDGGATLEEPLMKRRLHPALQLIDPDEQQSPSALDIKGQPTPIGDPGEHITCIMNWNPTDGRKHYDMIVVGTESETSTSGDCSGRLLCIGLKDIQENLSTDVKIRYKKKFPGQPVYSLCSYDKSSLLLCAGRDIVMLRLDIQARTWAQVSRYPLPSPALALATRGSLIYATTMYHSLAILECPGGKLALRASDMTPRNSNSVITCDNGFAIISSTSSTERGGKITGFSLRNDSKESKPIFHATLPLMVNHLRGGFSLPSDRSSYRCAYASTLDGTLYFLTTLSLDEWRILHFVESLIKHGRNELRRPGHGRRQRKATIELTNPDPYDMHIQGDVIAQVVSKGTQYLRGLLSQTVDMGNSSDDLPSAEERSQRFCTLSEAVIGKSNDPAESVVRWMRTFIRNEA